MQHLFGALSQKLQINQVEKVQKTAVHWTCKRWRITSSVSKMFDELEWLPAFLSKDSLMCSVVFSSIKKDKYLTPAQSSNATRSSHM